MGKNLFTTKQFIAAIPGTGGIISAIARKIGCDWRTANHYCRDYPTVKMVYDAEREGVLDMAETKLIEAIMGGDMAAIKFYLTTIGKKRGYTERQETFNLDLSQLSTEQLERIAKGEDVYHVLATSGTSGT